MTTSYELGSSANFLATNLVTNGTFDADASWIKDTGWSIAAGVAHCDGSQVAASNIRQTISVTPGKIYRVTFTLSNYSAGNVKALVGGNGDGTSRSSNDTYIEDIVCAGSSVFYIYCDADFIGDIDNVSVVAMETVTLYPEYDLKLGEKQVRNEHRSRSGKLYLYKWSDYEHIEFSLNWLPSSDAALVNSWWDSNAELLFFVNSGTATAVHSVMILNEDTPLQQFNQPYTDYYRGRILLEGY